MDHGNRYENSALTVSEFVSGLYQ